MTTSPHDLDSFELVAVVDFLAAHPATSPTAGIWVLAGETVPDECAVEPDSPYVRVVPVART